MLSEDDPSLDLPEKDRWAAGIYGKKRELSAALREGISETLGANGFRVAVADLNLEAAEATAKRITDAGGEAIAVHLDVTDTESVRGAVKTVAA